MVHTFNIMTSAIFSGATNKHANFHSQPILILNNSEIAAFFFEFWQKQFFMLVITSLQTLRFKWSSFFGGSTGAPEVEFPVESTTGTTYSAQRSMIYAKSGIAFTF